MIEVVITGKAKNGVFPYVVREVAVQWRDVAVERRSRQPLLDACRTLKRMGVDPTRPVGLFRDGSMVWNLRTTVGRGAGLTVHEEPSTRFMPFEPSPYA